MNMFSRYSILGLTAFVLLSGCSVMLHQSGGERAQLPGAGDYSEASIIVQTKDNTVMTFHDGWGLTWSGVRGSAEIQTGDGVLTVPDTTISYWNIDKAEASRRDNTTRQFLLTILGVILVIGLAAIILYAAFIATDR